MPYANTSPTYRIPYMSQGELSSGTSNRRAAFILDSQLSGVNRLIGSNGILQEGFYATVFTTNASAVTLVGTGTNYAMEAVVAGVYVAQNTTLSWTGIPDSSTVYLYIQTQENNLYTSTEFSSLAKKQVAAIWNTNGLTPTNSLLIGIVTTTTSTITLNTDSSISDSTFAQRPILQTFNGHRTASPIDHPAGSVLYEHLGVNIIKTRNIHPWDGITSGIGAYSLLSGTGIASNQIKPQAIDSRALAASLSISGLEIQNTLSTLASAVATLSGLTLVPGYRGTNLLEAVPLQILQNSLSGLQNFLSTGILPQSRGGTGVAALPKFSATNSGNQTITTSTWTKVAFQTELWDTNANFDPATNYRFTPSIAGKYMFLCHIATDSPAGAYSVVLDLYKNGTAYKRLLNSTYGGTLGSSVFAEANGSTDYFEVFVWHNKGSDSVVYQDATATFFEGAIQP